MQASPRLVEQFEVARGHADAMAKATTLAELNQHWTNFLVHLDRIWNRAEAHYGKSPRWEGWRGKYVNARKVDPVLSYLMHARNADEHQIEGVAEPHEQTTEINFNGPKLVSFSIVNGKFSYKGPPEDLSVKFTPAHLKLLPVTSRDKKVHQPPTSHAGKPVEPKPEAVAEVALKFYATFLADAEKFFVK